MRRYLLIALMLAVPLLATTSAQAVVVDLNALGQSTVAYNSSQTGGYVGLALVPGTCADLSNSSDCSGLAALGVPTVTTSGPCTDPALTSDLWEFGQADTLPSNGICYHGGSVTHANETFALTWDAPFASGAQHNYWEDTRNYVEQFLSDVAGGSGTLSSPFAVTSQYTDGSGRAAYSSVYGGGCIDNGAQGGADCEFGSPTGAGHDYPSNGCSPTGVSNVGTNGTVPNTVCLTDAQVQSEVATMATQTGIVGRTEPGHTPLVALLTPPGVETCLNATTALCSVNGSMTPPEPVLTTSASGGSLDAGTYEVEITYVTSSGESLPSSPATVTTTGTTSTITVESPAGASGVTGWYPYITPKNGTNLERQGSSPVAIGSNFVLSTAPANGPSPSLPPFFCSYHSRVNVGGTEVDYVVQPWSAWTACDEPDVPALGSIPTPKELETNAGERLVSPLSQATIAATVNPSLNGWFALDGNEINDNGSCTPLTSGLDTATVGSSTQNPYLLQHEFNNAGVIENDPYTYGGCAPVVVLSPQFVVPSSVNQGDEVQLDGSTTDSTLIVPESGYSWSFGDGTSATGPSVVHSYANGGTYTVKLTVTDRGGNVRTLSQAIEVLGSNGQPVVTGPLPTGGSGSSTPGSTSLQVRLALMPQSLRAILRSGISVRVKANEAADGFAQVSITRKAAKQAHIQAGRGPSVVIGRGTVSGIKSGQITLSLRLSKATVAKLRKLTHLKLTVRLSLVAAGGSHLAIVVAGSY